MFRKKEIELGYSLEMIKILYSELSIPEPNYGYA